MSRNLTQYGLSETAVTERNAEYPGTPLTDIEGDGTYDDPYLGMNRAGSNSPGVGINTGNIYQTAAELAANGDRYNGWTELDQDEVARIPQTTQHIGGIEASEDITVEPTFTPGKHPVNLILEQNGVTPDYNDTANFVIADTAAAQGAEMDSVSGAVNQTGAPVAIGDLVWGNVPVA